MHSEEDIREGKRFTLALAFSELIVAQSSVISQKLLLHFNNIPNIPYHVSVLMVSRQ